MTNFEYLTSSRQNLAGWLINIDEPMWSKMSAWYCTRICQHRVEKRYIYDDSITYTCAHSECVDTHSDEELIEMWLDAEHEE